MIRNVNKQVCIYDTISGRAESQTIDGHTVEQIFAPGAKDCQTPDSSIFVYGGKGHESSLSRDFMPQERQPNTPTDEA